MKFKLHRLPVRPDPLFRNHYPEIRAFFNGYPVVVFQGEIHSQDVASTRFITETLSYKFSECYFVIMGQVCEVLKEEEKSRNVVLIGTGDPDIKDVIFCIADAEIKFEHGDTLESDLSDLTPAARRIYHDLKKAIDQHQGRKFLCEL